MDDLATVTPRPHAALRFFDLLLRILTVLLVIVTAIAIPIMALTVTGNASLSFDARFEAPYTIRFDEGRSVKVDEGGTTEFSGFGVGDDRFLGEAPQVNGKVSVTDDDTDSRVVLFLAFGALMALTWMGLVNLRRIVRSARDGDPFNARNAIRLRWLGGAVIAAAVTVRMTSWIVDQTLDAPIPVHFAALKPGTLTLLIGGLALLALAEVFRAGSDLREFEQATI